MTREAWKIATVGDAVDPIARPEKVAPDRTYRLLGVRWYGRGCHLHATLSGDQLKTPQLNRVECGDVTYNKMWITKGAFAVAGPNCNDFTATNEYPLFTVRHGAATPEYLRWAMTTDAFVRAATDASRGSTSRRRLNPGDFLKLPMPLPVLGEQRKIAAILTAVDEAIEATQAVIDQLQTVKKALMAELLTRGLPGRHTRFKQTEIGEVPETWELAELGAVSLRITDGSHQAVKTSAESEVPFLYVSCVRDGEILWRNAARIPLDKYKEISRGREPRPGLILYTAVGSFGHAALVRDRKAFAFQRHIACVLPNESRVDPRYLVQWLNSAICRAHAERVAVGNAQKTVTLGKLREYPVPVPPMDEQLGITAALESLDERRLLETIALDELGSLKSALSSALLTGELRVTPDEDSP